MEEDDRADRTSQEPENENRPAARKPYVKPAYRHERVFATMAVACAKVPGPHKCRPHKKWS